MSWFYQPLPLGGGSPSDITGALSIVEDDDTMTAIGGAPPSAGSTTSHLRSFSSAEVGFVLLFSDIDLAYTTSDDIDGVSDAVSAATGGRWSNVRGGLDYPGAFSQKIEMFDASVDIPSASFRILDHDDTLISSVFVEAMATAQTELTASVDADDTSLTVLDTTAFASSGSLYVGTEWCDYSGKTSTTFTGLTRGKNSLFYKDTGSSYENGRPHVVDEHGTTGVYRPRVTARSATWMNRQVGLYLLHKQSGVWSAPGDGAQLLWAGRIKDFDESAGDGWITVETDSVHELLKTTLWQNPMKGRIGEGLWLTEATAQIRVTAYRFPSAGGALSKYEPSYATLTTIDAYRTHQQIAADINKQLLTWFNAVPGTPFPSTARMGLQTSPSDSGPGVYEFYVHDSSITAGDIWEYRIFMSPVLWQALGWSVPPTETARTPDGYQVVFLRLGQERSSGTKGEWHTTAPGPPNRYALQASPGALGSGIQIRVLRTEGEHWIAQPSVPDVFRGEPTGFLKIGSAVVPAKVASVSGDNYVFELTGALKGDAISAYLSADEEFNADAERNRVADVLLALERSGDDVEVQQVWCETGSIGEIFLKLLASTGTAGYNHATYDVYNTTLAVGVPWSLLDETSIYNLGREQYVLLLTEPVPFLKLFESALNYSNRYCVFRDGKISIVSIGEEWSGAERVVALTESNKAEVVNSAFQPVVSPTRVRRSPDGLVNRCTLRYHRSLDDKWKTATVNARASQTDFEQVKATKLDAYGIYDETGLSKGAGTTSWANRVVSTALAYFSRPLAFVERTYDYQVATRIYPGCRVSIEDNRIVNPVLGTRGVSGLLAWCVETNTDWRTGTGRGVFVFSPEHAGLKLAAWAPSARIDETASTGGYTRGYDSATKRIKLKQHEYSLSTEDKDLSWFSSGDKVRVIEFACRNSAAPRTWVDTINAVDEDNDYITLTTGLSGFPTSDGIFILEFDDIATVQSTQRVLAPFLADSGLTTGYATQDAYSYAGSPVEPSDTSVSTVTRYAKIPVTAYATGEPVSVAWAHELCEFLNQAAQKLTAPTFTCGNLWHGSLRPNGIASSSTDDGTIVYGPVWMPLYGAGDTITLEMQVDLSDGAAGVASDDGTITVVASVGLPRGTASVQPLNFLGATYVDVKPGTFTVASTVLVSNASTARQIVDVTLGARPFFAAGAPMLGCFLTVEAKVADAADQLRVWHVSARETR